MTLPELITQEEAAARLQVIFPRSVYDTVLSSPLAAHAVSSMLYLGAVSEPGAPPVEVTWVNPSQILWMPIDGPGKDDDDFRRAWAKASRRGRKTLSALESEWALTRSRHYGDNTRETLRDETFRQWNEYGAMRHRPGIKTNSPAPRWALLDDFAELFAPGLTLDDVAAAAELWRTAHMNPGAMLLAARAAEAAAAHHSVKVTLPGGTGERTLAPSLSNLIIKGVIEEWAPLRLLQPVVLAISEPGDKVHIGDDHLPQRIHVTIDSQNLLPDLLLADVGVVPVEFWFVEAVATDGPITEQRREQLLEWAALQGIGATSCHFLTAFEARNSAPAKRRLKDLAVGTWAWFRSEPNQELSWQRIGF